MWQGFDHVCFGCSSMEKLRFENYQMEMTKLLLNAEGFDWQQEVDILLRLTITSLGSNVIQFRMDFNCFEEKT